MLPVWSGKRKDEISCNSGERVGKHLRSIEDKPDDCKMRNIDFIYLINLDQRPEKFAQSKEQLDVYEIHPYRFSAVNGWELPLEVINDVGVKFESYMEPNYLGNFFLGGGAADARSEIMQRAGQTYFCHGFSRGALGCMLSHLSVLQDAYDSGYSTIWVMEDDIQIIQNPHRLSDLIDELDGLVGKDKWDVLFTDVDTKNQQDNYVPCMAYAIRPNYSPADPSCLKCNQKISLNLRKIGARYGAYSMIVRRSGIKKLLEFIKAHGVFAV